MKLLKIVSIAALAIGVAGCASVDTVSRNAPLDIPEFGVETRALTRSYSLQEVKFAAPETLTVSEANAFYPRADVVWRGDPYGDRVEQIGEIFKTAAARNQTVLDGDIPVVAEVTLLRFHGVTERTRFTVGGVYNIEFSFAVRNAVTGELIEQPRMIEADLPAPGGAVALMMDQTGQTEKVRVTDFLTQVLKDELSGSYAI